MGYQTKVKLFTLMIACFLFIFTFSHVGASTFRTYFSGELFTDGTMIGPIDVSGLTKDEAKQRLQTEINKWNHTAEVIIMNGGDQEKIVKDELFVFPIEEVVKLANSGSSNPLPVVVNKQRLEDTLQSLTQKKLDSFKQEDLYNDLKEKASKLSTGAIEVSLVNYIIVDETEVISEATILNISDDLGIYKWVKEVGEIQIEPAQSFSLSKFMSQLEGSTFSDDTLSIIATGIYEAILPTNFKIIERHISSELPTYAKLGYEARYGRNKDLIFYNINPYQYKLKFSRIEKGLHLQLIGAKLPGEYKISLEDETVYNPKTIKQYSDTVKSGKVEVKENGKKGQMITVYRTSKVNDKEPEKVKLSEDYYRPVHRIEVHGLIDISQLIPSVPESINDESNVGNVEVEQEEIELNDDDVVEEESLWNEEFTEK
ncbi:G5 domain-containing protein [Fredinandcohnia onubensis]|uniref:G5 domain-containing protein n=1 Tax=Fredinandcohnia onubensis TaxID=1571209 RepID=UPI0015D501B4|nr:G5 domain-containing protein [Fredinandcohnia onubensis]